MRRNLAPAAALLALFALAPLAGCNGGGTGSKVNAGPVSAALSPLVGEWSGKSDMKDKGVGTFVNSIEGGPLTGPSSLTLNADGTGFLKVADQAEKPITWKQEGDKVTLQAATQSEGQNSGKAQKPSQTAGGVGPWVATLSNDKKTLTIDMEKVKVTLHRVEG